MKVAITGHTKGIGQAIANLYTDHIGFSRSNGYDISVADNRYAILNESKDCDVFINNAWHDSHQVSMFDEIFYLWQHDRTKTIVNIGSMIKYSRDDSVYFQNKYQMFHHSIKPERKCRVININPGFTDTDFYKIEDESKQRRETLKTEQVAKYVKWALDQPCEIFELSFSGSILSEFA